jgi:hypothetical protein
VAFVSCSSAGRPNAAGRRSKGCLCRDQTRILASSLTGLARGWQWIGRSVRSAVAGEFVHRTNVPSSSLSESLERHGPARCYFTFWLLSGSGIALQLKKPYPCVAVN